MKSRTNASRGEGRKARDATRFARANPEGTDVHPSGRAPRAAIFLLAALLLDLSHLPAGALDLTGAVEIGASVRSAAGADDHPSRYRDLSGRSRHAFGFDAASRTREAWLVRARFTDRGDAARAGRLDLRYRDRATVGFEGRSTPRLHSTASGFETLRRRDDLALKLAAPGGARLAIAAGAQTFAGTLGASPERRYAVETRALTLTPEFVTGRGGTGFAFGRLSVGEAARGYESVVARFFASPALAGDRHLLFGAGRERAAGRNGGATIERSRASFVLGDRPAPHLAFTVDLARESRRTSRSIMGSAYDRRRSEIRFRYDGIPKTDLTLALRRRSSDERSRGRYNPTLPGTVDQAFELKLRYRPSARWNLAVAALLDRRDGDVAPVTTGTKVPMHLVSRDRLATYVAVSGRLAPRLLAFASFRETTTDYDVSRALLGVDLEKRRVGVASLTFTPGEGDSLSYTHSEAGYDRRGVYRFLASDLLALPIRRILTTANDERLDALVYGRSLRRGLDLTVDLARLRATGDPLFFSPLPPVDFRTLEGGLELSKALRGGRSMRLRWHRSELIDAGDVAADGRIDETRLTWRSPF